DEEEAARRLKAIEGLSFVKVRPADNRVFLQDEMYDLLQRHVLEALPAPRSKKIYARLVAYYEEEIERLRERMHKLTTRSTPDWVTLSDVRIALQNAITERIHYELRHDPVKGFGAYYRAAEEAFQSRHLSMDMQLREELLTFLKQAPPPEETGIAGWAEWDAGVRWVKRHIMREDYEQAIETAGRLRGAGGNLDDLKAALGPLAEAELDIWEATARTYAGEGLSRAQGLFESAIAAIRAFEATTEFERWKCTYLLAHANNNLGYLLRTRGAYQETVKCYVEALAHWRRLKDEFKADHANTLNNLAFALAQMGDFNQAIRYCTDALEMREEIGPRYPIALSLNTLAEIQIQNDQPHRAQWMAERALEQFQQVTQARGVGMAYRALAEALRRQAEIPLMYSPQQQIKRLRKAESFADEASAIFAHEAPEQSRLVGTLIELGCIYRNWARILPKVEEESQEPSEETSEEIPQPEDLADRATRTLQRAIRETGAEFAHLRMDAFVNLAWHHYYLDDPGQARLVLEQRAFPLAEDYLITREGGVPQLTDPITFYWVLLGKAHFLLGEMEMDAFRELDCWRPDCWEEEAGQRLAAAGEYYTLAVAYDQLFGYDFREMRRGLDLIYHRLKKLNDEELGVVYDAAHETARDYDLKKPPRFARFLEETFGLRTPRAEVS
ncbi:MAG: tetratricopeptide repeat protein, partial [Anaerolineae bacterium]